MSSLVALSPDQASPEAQATLGAIHAALGITPNLYRVAANSPAALNALVGLNAALAKGSLRPKIRESIALDVAQENGCDYCLSAHTAIGKGAGLSDADVANARAGSADDAHADAILKLTNEIVRSRGRLAAGALDRAMAAGVSAAEVIEIVGNVALNVFTNYLNILADTEIDFPIVRAEELAVR